MKTKPTLVRATCRMMMAADLRAACITCVLVCFLGGNEFEAGAGDLTFAAPEQAGLSPLHLNHVDAQLMKYVQSNQVSGTVALVARRGRIAYLKAFGLRDVEANLPMETNTLFRIASMSKLVTSIGLMTLVNKSAVGLDDPVSRFIPEFAAPTVITQGDRNRKTRPSTKEITIRHLLTHTSGIIYRFVELFPLSTIYTEAGVSDGLVAREGTIGDMVKVLAKQPLWFTPGTAWEYGLNTDVLGYLIEVVSGKPLDLYLRENVFDPLGMFDTMFHVPAEKRYRLAAVYEPVSGGGIRRIPDDPPVVKGNLECSPSHAYERPGTYFSGGGGLVSTAHDYARLLQMLLNGGELGGRRLLSPQRVLNLTTNGIGNLSPGSTFGMGSVGVSTTPQSLEWTGTYSWGGFWNTSYQADPLEQLILVQLSQLYPGIDIWTDFSRAAYESITEARLFMTRPGVNSTLRWRLPSLVPQPGRQMLAGYRILQSSDLEAWDEFGVSQNSALGNPRTLSRSIPADISVRFLKLEFVRDFAGRNLSGSRLVDADFRGTALGQAVLEGADLSRSDLRGAVLSGANLRRANLTDANLTGASGFDANQEGIIFRNTVMPDGSLRSN